MTNAAAGDTVYFRGGSYDPGASCPSTWEYVAMTPRNSGTAADPITFKAYPGETPVILACPPYTAANPSNMVTPAFGARDVSYIIWDGFSSTMIDGPGEMWLFLYWNSKGSKVRNCNFTGVNHLNEHPNAAPVRIEQSSDNEVSNNFIHGMNGGTNTGAIWIFASARVKVHHNTIANGANGIMQKTGPNVDNEIYNNFLYSLTMDGIRYYDEVAGSGDKAYQNVIVSANFAIDGMPGSGATQTNLQIFNNTIYGAKAGIGVGDYARSAQVWNNIIYNTGNTAAYVRYYPGLSLPSYSDYNDFSGSGGKWSLGYQTDYPSLASWRSAMGFDGSSTTTDPQFVKPGGANASDYRRKSYPPNGKGGSVMGAYMTGSESIGCLPPPANLRR